MKVRFTRKVHNKNTNKQKKKTLKGCDKKKLQIDKNIKRVQDKQ